MLMGLHYDNELSSTLIVLWIIVATKMKGGSKGNLISGGNFWPYLWLFYNGRVLLECNEREHIHRHVSETFWSCYRQRWTRNQQGSLQECWGTCSSPTCRQTPHANPLCCQVRLRSTDGRTCCVHVNARLITSARFPSLPKVIKRRLKALKKLQVQANHLEASFFEELHKLECQYQTKYQSLYDKVQIEKNADCWSALLMKGFDGMCCCFFREQRSWTPKWSPLTRSANGRRTAKILS